jgi:hypothetical protein
LATSARAANARSTIGGAKIATVDERPGPRAEHVVKDAAIVGEEVVAAPAPLAARVEGQVEAEVRIGDEDDAERGHGDGAPGTG